MAEAPRIAAQIARAIVHLNFQEPDQALEVLLDALTDCNFVREKENVNVVTSANA